MSEVAIGEKELAQSPFARSTMLAITAIGVLAFLAMLVLGAYAPDLRSGKNGGAHALSNAATGFSGIVRLGEATGRNPLIARAVNQLDVEDLAVITAEEPGADLSGILERRGPRVTLLVLPKWQTQADPRHPGWVRIRGLLPAFFPEGVLAPAYKLEVGRVKERGTPLRTVHPTATTEFGFTSPEVTQFVRGDSIEPVVVDAKGRVVLAKAKDRNLYILADPDLLNNHGMTSKAQSAAALALLDFLNSTGAGSILFDVTANGLGHSRSPLKLAFDPPFLAVTLVLFVALLMASWQALVRFGEPRRQQRAIAFGKAALVENSAALIRKAGREVQLSDRYVLTIRERSAALFRLPPSLKGKDLDDRLDALPSTRRFSELAAEASSARSREELLAAARNLDQWLEEVAA